MLGLGLHLVLSDAGFLMLGLQTDIGLVRLVLCRQLALAVLVVERNLVLGVHVLHLKMVGGSLGLKIKLGGFRLVLKVDLRGVGLVGIGLLVALCFQLRGTLLAFQIDLGLGLHRLNLGRHLRRLPGLPAVTAPGTAF
jgi:hypothetical protein